MSKEKFDDWVFEFDLSKKISFPGNLTNSATIEFKKENRLITGFTITVKNSSRENAEQLSKNEAKNLANIITIKSGMPIEAVLQGYHSIHQGRVIANFVIRLGGIEGSIKDLDVNNTHIQSIIESSEPVNLTFDYLSKGIFHYYNGNPVDCIKELFLAIEKGKSFPEYEKYRALRNVFSHKPPYEPKTVNSFLSFFDSTSFDFKKFEPNDGWIIIDLESNKNIRSLNGIAKDVMDQVRDYLDLPRF